MPSVEERLARLEGRVHEQGAFMADVRGSVVESVADVRREIELRFVQVDKRFDQIDERFELVDKRFEQIDKRFERIDMRFEQIDMRFDKVDQRFDRVERQFTWVIGLMVTGFVSVIGALVGRI